MSAESPTLFVGKFYEMDPDLDDLLPDGTHLRDGMIVLIEDTMIRVDLDRLDSSPYELDRAKENNRWCEVSHLTITERRDHGAFGEVVGSMSPLISFVGIYPDGTKRKRRYDSSYAWLVRRIDGGAA